MQKLVSEPASLRFFKSEGVLYFSTADGRVFRFTKTRGTYIAEKIDAPASGEPEAVEAEVESFAERCARCFVSKYSAKAR